MKRIISILFLLVSISLLFSSCNKESDSGNSCDHDFGDWESEREPTCKEEGLMVRYCEDCGKRDKVKVPVINTHTVVLGDRKEPTCTEFGLTEGSYCSVCDKVIEQQIPIDPLGHDFSQWTTEIAPTCKDEGLLVRECFSCGKIEKSTAPKTEIHTVVIDNYIAPTCTESGLTEGKHCSVCDTVLVAQIEIGKVAHAYDDKYDESCNECGFIRDAECAHKNVNILSAKEPTCTEMGLTEGKVCVKCEEILVAQETIPANGHTPSNWIVVSDATANENGYKYKICNVCLIKLAEEYIPAYGLSADQQAVRNMNTALAIANNPDNLDDAIDALIENGFNGENLVPVSKGYSYVWSTTDYTIKLVKTAEIKADEINLADGVKYIDVIAKTADDIVNALALGSEYIKLDADITFDRDISIEFGNITLNLNGHTFNSIRNANGRSSVIYIRENAALTVENGTFNVRSFQNYGDLTIKPDVVINAMDITGGGCVRNKPGATLVIEGGTFNVVNFIAWDEVNWGGAAGVYNDGGTVTIKGGTFTSNTDAYLISNVNNGNMTIEGGTFTAHRGAVATNNSVTVIKDGTFSVTADSNGGHVICHEGTGSTTLNGGEYSSATDRDFCGNITFNYYKSAYDQLVEAIARGDQRITLSSNIIGCDAIVIPAGTTVEIDLGGKTIATGTRNPYDHQYALNVFGTVTITNGTINARGVEVRNGGKLIIGEGVTINAVDDNGGAAIYLYKGAEVEINGGTFKSLAAQSELTGGSVVLNNGGKLTINGGTFISEVNGPYVINHQGGETIINGGTFKAVRGVVGAQVSGTVTINGGTFTKTDLSNKAGYEAYCDGNATLVINGGTFTNDIYYGPITDNR